jgi:tetratricopeptide (TPR) repeat protein
MGAKLATHKQELTRFVNQYFDKEDYAVVIDLLQKEIEQTPDEHWLYAQLAISYYELRDYKMAMQFSEKAVNLSPDCPLALDYHASILLANGKAKEALLIWNNLLDRDIDDIAHGDCGEGVRFAKSLLNDIRFSVGDAYIEMKNKEKALWYYKSHLANRQKGVFSNFKRSEVLKEIKKLEENLTQ